MVEWLCCQKMQSDYWWEWRLDKTLIMWILWCAKSCEGKLQLFQNWWLDSLPSSGLSAPTKLGRTHLWNLHISTQSAFSWPANSKARPTWAEEPTCNETLRHRAITSLPKENSLIIEWCATDVQFIHSTHSDTKEAIQKPNSNSILRKPHVICHHKKSKGKDLNR